MGSESNLRQHFLLLFSTFLYLSAAAFAIGVNYGTLGNNLPPPAQVANFLRTQTYIDKIKLFDANPDILRAFANTGFDVTVSVANADIPALLNIDFAKAWVASNILPFRPQTRIIRICVGNEIFNTGSQELMDKLVPAMRSLHQALLQSGITDIQVTTAHSLGILLFSEPPSIGRFRPGWDTGILAPMLQFLRETKSPFMVNPYPYFAYTPQKENYCLFRKNPGVHDKFTHITYTNMYDAMLDAIHSAMKRLGYGDVGIVVGEIGWPSLCEPGQNWCSLENAAWFNGVIVRRSFQKRKGTPLMPNRQIETYLFSLFNENLKPGPTAERNWGLFWPDFTPVYNSGIMRNGQVVPRPAPSPVTLAKKWCVPRPEATDQQLQSNLNYACTQGVDCRPIQIGGACAEPNTVRSRAAFAMNSFYQTHGGTDSSCDFAHTGMVTNVDPSYGSCRYL